MGNAAQLKAEPRKQSGKGGARAVRREGKVPAIVYGGNAEELPISLCHKTITTEYQRGYFTSRVFDMEIGGKNIHVIPRDVQLHPVTDSIEHVDFQRIQQHAQVRVNVSLRFLNGDKCIGIKRGGALNIVRREIEFTCDVDAVPEKIDIDLATVNIGQTVHVGDIALPRGVEPVLKRNFTIASVVGRSKDDETADAATAAPAAAAADDKKKDEKKKEEKKKK